MAAPAEIKIFDYGPPVKYKMNMAITDKHDDILATQGVGLLKRKAISIATITRKSPNSVVTNRHYKTADGIEVFESKSTASGIPGACEEIHCDGKPRADNHSLYGQMITTGYLKTPAEINDPYMTADFLPESFDEQGRLFYAESESNPEKNTGPPWKAVVASGFRMVDGVKRWVRTNHFWCPVRSMDRTVTIYYDWVGKAS